MDAGAGRPGRLLHLAGGARRRVRQRQDQELIQFSPTDRLLSMHAQMAHAPAVLAAYVSISRATAQLGTLDQPVRASLMLAASSADGSEYGTFVNVFAR